MSRSSYIQAQVFDLDRLMEEIAAGQLAIPDFQREFVWSDNRVRSLLGTVFNGWPAGSLLVMRFEVETEFRLRHLSGAPPLSAVRTVVLDGQQRLTALYQALHDTGDSVFALDIEAFDPVRDDYTALEDRIVTFKHDEWQAKLSTPRAQLSRRLVPISSLSSPSSFFSWRDSVMEVEGAADGYREVLTNLYRDHLSTVHRYAFPAVMLESDLPVSAIARIFERVNREGLRLNAFDLMVARVYEPNWHLREEWENAQADYPVIEEFLGDNGMPILQSISLKLHKNIRQAAVLDMEPSLVRSEWPAAVDATVGALEFLRGQCGVADPAWLPYEVMAVGMAALLMQGGQVAGLTRDLARWYWDRAFTLRFEAAANTRIVADYEALLSGGLDSLERYPISESVLATATRRSRRALWGAFMSALWRHGSRDLLGADMEASGGRGREALTYQTVFEKDDRSSHLESPLHLRILGLTQVSRESAAVIRRNGFRRSLSAAVDLHGSHHVDGALESQFLPPSDEILDGRGISAQDMLSYRLDQLEMYLSGIAGLSVER